MTSDNSPPVTWQDIARWGASLTFVAAAMFWLARIDNAVATVKADVAEIKSSVRAHIALPAHPVAEYRLQRLERKK